MKLITLPLKTFLDVLWTNRSHFQGWATAPSVEVAEMIKSIDEFEELAHVEFPSIENPTEQFIPKIWLIHAWRESVERFRAQKIASEIARQWRFKRDERLAALRIRIQEELNMTPDDPIISVLIDKIYNKRNVELAGRFGVDINDILP